MEHTLDFNQKHGFICGMESGMSTVLVLSGVSSMETLKTYAYRPSIVLDSKED